MRVSGTLEMALDFAERRAVPHEVVSKRIGEQWYVLKRGPKYANQYRVTSYDEEGLEWLLEHEVKPQPKEE